MIKEVNKLKFMTGFVGSRAKKRKRNIFLILGVIIFASIIIFLFPSLETENNEVIPNENIIPDPIEDLTSLLSNVEALDGNIAINGTNSTSAHAGDNIVNEQPIDFSAETTTITDSGGASGTIVSVDIGKGTTSIGTKAETTPSYGVDISSLIREDLY